MPVATYLFGLGCVVAMIFSRHDTDRLFMARSLTVVWALANAAWLYNCMWALPVLDWFLGALALITWWTNKSRWAWLFVQVVTARLILHVLDYLTGDLYLVPYIHALNATFVFLLVVVSYQGGRYDFDNLLRRVRRLRSILAATPRGGMSRGHR